MGRWERERRRRRRARAEGGLGAWRMTGGLEQLRPARPPPSLPSLPLSSLPLPSLPLRLDVQGGRARERGETTERGGAQREGAEGGTERGRERDRGRERESEREGEEGGPCLEVDGLLRGVCEGAQPQQRRPP
eukprot:816217-Rhodomonas_salina.2